MEKGFVLYPTYDIQDNNSIVQIFGKLESGETFRIDHQCSPHFFISGSNEARAKELVPDLKTEKTDLKSFSGEKVIQVNVNIPKEVPELRKLFENEAIQCFEADIRFAYRYLLDHNIKGGIAIEGEWKKGQFVDRIYTSPKVKPAVWNGTFTILSIDIETDKKADDLWSISLSTKNRQEKMIVARQVKGAHCFDDEASLLAKLTELIQEIDPDILTGWNFIDFDLKFLQDKYRKYKLPMDWSRSDRPVKLRVQQDFLRESTAIVTGRIVLDGISLLKNNFVNLDSYTLENAAGKFSKRQKLFTGKTRYKDIENAYHNDPEKLLEYNMLDTLLVHDIIEESGALNLAIKRSTLTGMQLDRVKASIASLDMVYLPRLRKRGFVAPSVGYVTKDEGIRGGFVMDSKPGIYDYVIVCDFKSLYPSIMRTLNIDPLMFQPQEKIDKSTSKLIRAENGAVFKQEQGILPEILDELLQAREKSRKEGDELSRYAIKILMNSFFGALASPNCRFFSMAMANAITHSGQHFIKQAAEFIQNQGFELIYGDTDSIFIDLKIDSEEDAIKKGTKIENEVNKFFTKYIQDHYHRDSKLELEYEKTFIRFLMPMTRSGEGSKKRYAGLIKKDGKERIDFTGLEFVRRDWTEVAKHLQLTVLDLIFHKKDPVSFIKTFVEEIRSGKHDDKLLYRKALRKNLDEYTKTTPPHVKAARQLDKIESNLIEYFQTVDGPEPKQKLRHTIDYEHYIEKQIKPIADSILVFYNTSFDDVMKGTTQKGLFDF